jgi:predicted transcriptional regulator
MKKKNKPRPTDAELEILKVLWRLGPSTVREVHDHLSAQRAMGYTTVLKMLQIMSEKNLVERDEQNRAHVYVPQLAQEETERQLVGDLLERAFNGSAKSLVMHALSGKKASVKDLAEIRRILDKLEGGRK